MSERLHEPTAGLTGKAMRRVVMGSFAGALLEWYDFFIFGTAAGLVFAPLFFPDSDPFIGVIAAFATFGVGFLTRPLGALFSVISATRLVVKSPLSGRWVLSVHPPF
jgi:MHS family shikimate/dehydroshikimate transporter-like MFS transporter